MQPNILSYNNVIYTDIYFEWKGIREKNNYISNGYYTFYIVGFCCNSSRA